MPNYFQKRKMQTQQAEFIQWLQAILSDEKRREMLQVLLRQYELPVINIGKKRTADR